MFGLINSVQCGDAAFVLKQLPDASADLVITSPPYFQQRTYNAASMGMGTEKSIEDYIDTLMDVFDEVVRVIKPTGNKAVPTPLGKQHRTVLPFLHRRRLLLRPRTLLGR